MKGHFTFERRWRWTYVFVEAWADALHRPIFGLNRVFSHVPHGWEFHPNRVEVSLSWGDSHCDPLWFVDIEVPAPRWLVERVSW